MSISVIIPTFNRAQVLRKTLHGYAGQSGDHQICEILVVDDGSKDDTASVVQEWDGSPILNVRYLRQENRGPAAARNHAIREAKGDLLLFGDDDVIPGSNMVAEHVAWHRKNPAPNLGALGLVTWAAEVNATPFMAWSGLYGPQFRYGYFKAGMEVDFREAYGCNISAKRHFITQHGGFNEDIRSAGYEDLEFCYRLCLHGFRLIYVPEAVGSHYKFETFDDTRRRIEKLYSAWPMFATTDAGKRFFDLYRAEADGREGWTKSKIRRFLKPFKSAMMPLARPLMDTRLPLPHWLYSQVFYYYVTPFVKFLDHPDAGPAAPGTLEDRKTTAGKK
jgi:GT2 family glycosyltransferase